jgi:hypothetical protein
MIIGTFFNLTTLSVSAVNGVGGMINGYGGIYGTKPKYLDKTCPSTILSTKAP